MIIKQFCREILKVFQRYHKMFLRKVLSGSPLKCKLLVASKRIVVTILAFVLESKVLSELVDRGEDNLFSYIRLILTSFSSFCLTQKVGGEGRYFLQVFFMKFIFKFFMNIYMRYNISLKPIH